MQTFTKRTPAGRGAFEYEARGLRWLAAANGAAVVGVTSVSESQIVLERVPSGRPSPEAALEFGRALARTHDAGAEAFGAPPDGWSGDGWIGVEPMPLEPTDTWGLFYAEQRCRVFARRARDRGGLSAGEVAVVDRLCDRIAAGEFDDDAPPARIHGDLWSGNVMPSPARFVLIDPAAHGGHRLTDLAMLAVFGFPHLEQVYAAYASESAYLPDGWPDLIGLHQLHPLLVHAAIFGGGYGSQAAAVARRY